MFDGRRACKCDPVAGSGRCMQHRPSGWLSERMGVPRQQGAPNMTPSQQRKRTP